MATDTTRSLGGWTKTLPVSRIIFPQGLHDRLKYFLWRVYTPMHPFVRDTLLSLGVIQHVGRQDYLLGKIAEGQSIQEFAAFLISCGYGNHFVAWEDEGEVVSLRRVEDFSRQYHIRIFEDREVRGHYEYTPESYPILHLKEVGQQDRREEFLRLLGDKIVPHP